MPLDFTRPPGLRCASSRLRALQAPGLRCALYRLRRSTPTTRSRSSLCSAIACLRVTLKPGSKGTKKLVTQFGERLVCVRYRYDAVAHVRYNPVKLVVEQLPWNPAQRVRRQGARPRRPPVLVGFRVHFHEKQLRKRVKDAGGRWLPHERLWVVPNGVARRLGLADRAAAVPDLPTRSVATMGTDPGG